MHVLLWLSRKEETPRFPSLCRQGTPNEQAHNSLLFPGGLLNSPTPAGLLLLLCPNYLDKWNKEKKTSLASSLNLGDQSRNAHLPSGVSWITEKTRVSCGVSVELRPGLVWICAAGLCLRCWAAHPRCRLLRPRSFSRLAGRLTGCLPNFFMISRILAKLVLLSMKSH